MTNKLTPVTKKTAKKHTKPKPKLILQHVPVHMQELLVWVCWAELQYAIQHRTVVISSFLSSRKSSLLSCCLSDKKETFMSCNKILTSAPTPKMYRRYNQPSYLLTSKWPIMYWMGYKTLLTRFNMSTWKVFRIGTVRYNWPMSVHVSEACSIAHCTDSENLPSTVSENLLTGCIFHQIVSWWKLLETVAGCWLHGWHRASSTASRDTLQ